jgi:hypothetical protein
VADDEIQRLTEMYGKAGIHEGAEITVGQLITLRGAGFNMDHDLHTYFMRAGTEISATVAPVGFVAGGPDEEPTLETMETPPDVDPGWIVVSANDQAARLISKVDAVCPLPAGQTHAPGSAGLVRIVVSKDGRVLSAEATGDPRLRRTAEEAVKQWIYSPAVVNGFPVEVVTEAYPNVCPFE